MAILNSQGNLLTVDPTSKAIRATPYDSLGNEPLDDNPISSYIVPLKVMATATLSNSQIMWIMQNPDDGVQNPYTLTIRRICGSIHFNGTAVLASTSGWQFTKFRSASWTALGSGNSGFIVKKRTSYGGYMTAAGAPSNAVGRSTLEIQWDASGNAGMTAPAGIYWNPTTVDIHLPTSITGRVKPFDMTLDWQLGHGEGLALIAAGGAAGWGPPVTGFGIDAFVEWDHRNL